MTDAHKDDEQRNTPKPAANVPSEMPPQGRLLGIDYGTKRVGIAVSDVDQRFSSPLYNYDRVNREADARYFQKVVTDHQAVGFVVGLPLHMSGEESEKSAEARRYGRWLNGLMNLPVAFQDERLSSVQAERFLLAAELTKKKRQARMDKLAAQILLQSWLDGQRPVEEPKPQPDS